MKFEKLAFILLSLAGAANARSQTNVEKVQALQMAKMIQMEKLIDSMTRVDGVPDRLKPISYKSSLVVLKTPIVISNGTYNSSESFEQPAVISANDWDWTANDVWTMPVTRAQKKVYARITLSMSGSTNHSPCLSLRRSSLVGSTWQGRGSVLKLGCSELSRRNNSGSVQFWTEWWHDNVGVETYGAFTTQKLELGASSNYSGDAAGSVSWTLHGYSIDLFEAF